MTVPEHAFRAPNESAGRSHRRCMGAGTRLRRGYRGEAGAAGERLSEGFGERELKVVRTLSVGELDRYLAGNTSQLTVVRIWHHRDGLLLRPAGHGAAVLQQEAVTATAQSTGALSEELD
jgi:hypothetical protein